MGMGLAWVLDWSMLAGFFFGLSLSVASTVVLLRALQAHNLIETERGRIATGWLIVEDTVKVLAMVLLPDIAQTADRKDVSEGTSVSVGWNPAGTRISNKTTSL